MGERSFEIDRELLVDILSAKTDLKQFHKSLCDKLIGQTVHNVRLVGGKYVLDFLPPRKGDQVNDGLQLQMPNTIKLTF